MSVQQQVDGGIAIDKVYASVLRENYAAFVGETAPKKIDEAVKGLQAHFAAGKVALMKCDICMASSPEDLDHCPFCNDGIEANLQPPPTPFERKKKPEPSSAPALSLLSGAGASASEKDLDDELLRFKAAAASGAGAYYLMGASLKKMRDRLWQQRVDGGKPKYKSYSQFCVEEIGISRSTGDRMIGVVECFSLDQFQKHGAAWLKALLPAPRELHQELLGRVEQGEFSTAAALEREVKDIREKNGVTVVQSPSTEKARAQGKNVPSASTTAAGAAAKKKPTAAITVGLAQTEGTVKLFARPKKAAKKPNDDVASAEKVRARTVEDQPYGTIETINGVRLALAIRKTPAGELEIKWAAKRDEEDDSE